MVELKLITPSITDAVSLTEAKAFLRETSTAEDAFITRLIKDGVGFVEDYTKCGILEQVWSQTYRSFFPADGFVFHRYPVTEIQAVKYLDTDGVEQTLDSSVYVLNDRRKPAELYKVSGESWPDTRDSAPDAVTVEFVVESSGAELEGLKLGVLLFVGHYYENRQGQPLPDGFFNYLDKFQIAPPV